MQYDVGCTHCKKTKSNTSCNFTSKLTKTVHLIISFVNFTNKWSSMLQVILTVQRININHSWGHSSPFNIVAYLKFEVWVCCSLMTWGLIGTETSISFVVYPIFSSVTSYFTLSMSFFKLFCTSSKVHFINVQMYGV